MKLGLYLALISNSFAFKRVLPPGCKEKLGLWYQRFDDQLKHNQEWSLYPKSSAWAAKVEQDYAKTCAYSRDGVLDVITCDDADFHTLIKDSKVMEKTFTTEKIPEDNLPTYWKEFKEGWGQCVGPAEEDKVEEII